MGRQGKDVKVRSRIETLRDDRARERNGRVRHGIYTFDTLHSFYFVVSANRDFRGPRVVSQCPISSSSLAYVGEHPNERRDVDRLTLSPLRPTPHAPRSAFFSSLSLSPFSSFSGHLFFFFFCWWRLQALTTFSSISFSLHSPFRHSSHKPYRQGQPPSGERCRSPSFFSVIILLPFDISLLLYRISFLFPLFFYLPLSLVIGCGVVEFFSG